MSEVLEVIRCVLLYIPDGGLCLLEVSKALEMMKVPEALEMMMMMTVPEAMRCVRLCMRLCMLWRVSLVSGFRHFHCRSFLVTVRHRQRKCGKEFFAGLGFE